MTCLFHLISSIQLPSVIWEMEKGLLIFPSSALLPLYLVGLSCVEETLLAVVLHQIVMFVGLAFFISLNNSVQACSIQNLFLTCFSLFSVPCVCAALIEGHLLYFLWHVV